MNMKRFSIISLLLWIGILAFASGKPKVMWLDCSANFQRFSYPDSIRFYVDKCHEAGITHLVLDIKDNTSTVRILTLSVPLSKLLMPAIWSSLPE